MIPANAVNAAAFKIDVAVAGRVGFPAGEAKRKDGFDIRRATLMTGTLEDHVEHLKVLKLGRTVEVPPVYMAVLSASDETIAPEGEDVLYLHSNVPADPVTGWDETTKALYTDAIVTSAKRFLDGLDAEIGRVVHTPRDFEERWSTPKGAYFHVDMGPLRLGVNRRPRASAITSRRSGGCTWPGRARTRAGRSTAGAAGTPPAGRWRRRARSGR